MSLEILNFVSLVTILGFVLTIFEDYKEENLKCEKKGGKFLFLGFCLHECQIDRVK